MPYADPEKRRACSRMCALRYYRANRELCQEKKRKRREIDRETNRIHAAKYYREHKEKRLADYAEWKKANPEYHKKWAEKNRAKRNAQSAARYHIRKSDPGYHTGLILRSRIGNALRGRGAKSARTLTLLGCSIEFLREHIEKQFKPGMTWKNHGQHGWHVDHILPCAAFHLQHSEEQEICFHWTNLQPLWASHNRSKHDKLCC